MKVVPFVGRQNHGKTTLICQLIPELAQRGYRLGAVKHSSHAHEVDRPGKDSHRIRQAGALPVALVTPELTAIYQATEERSPLWGALQSMRDCDLVLLEGGIDRPGPKVELWRAEVGGEPLAQAREDVVAIISDELPPLERELPIWPRSDLQALCSCLEAKLSAFATV